MNAATAYTQGHVRIRWRLNDPAEENRERWTRTHITNTSVTDTLCGLAVPFAYMQDMNSDIPKEWPFCKRCHAKVFAWGESYGRAFLESMGGVMTATYIVQTRSFGELRKADDSIAGARAWAKRAFDRGEVLSVQRERPRRCDDCAESRQPCSRCRRLARG